MTAGVAVDSITVEIACGSTSKRLKAKRLKGQQKNLPLTDTSAFEAAIHALKTTCLCSLSRLHPLVDLSDSLFRALKDTPAYFAYNKYN